MTYIISIIMLIIQVIFVMIIKVENDVCAPDVENRK